MKHFVIPDLQAKPGVDLSHCTWIGKHIRKLRPEVIVCLGDLYDMPSLSRWTTQAKKAVSGYSVKRDLDAGKRALDKLMAPFCKLKSYSPKLIFTTGNHENRINRLQDELPNIAESISDFREPLRQYGWKVYPFLSPVRVDGIQYAHYFVRSAKGTVTGSKNGMASALTQARREMISSVAGHKQGLDCAILDSGNKRVRAIIAGSCYQHKEDYLTDQGNHHWQGVLVLDNVNRGDFDLHEFSLRTLRRMYEV